VRIDAVPNPALQYLLLLPNFKDTSSVMSETTWEPLPRLLRDSTQRLQPVPQVLSVSPREHQVPKMRAASLPEDLSRVKRHPSRLGLPSFGVLWISASRVRELPSSNFPPQRTQRPSQWLLTRRIYGLCFYLLPPGDRGFIVLLFLHYRAEEASTR